MPGDKSNTAVVVRVPDGQSPKLSKEDIRIPSPESNQVLVKISHVAQNPTDGMHSPQNPENIIRNWESWVICANTIQSKPSTPTH